MVQQKSINYKLWQGDTYIPRRGKEKAFGSDSNNNSNFRVWSIVKYLQHNPETVVKLKNT